MITGKDLIQLGYAPAPWFKTALNYIATHQLQGNALIQYLEKISAQTSSILPYEKAIPFHKNILAQTAAELENLNSVENAMQSLLTTPTLVNAAIMPDACPTGRYQIPVGGIAVAKNAIHPAMHSADICCSVMLTNFGYISPKEVLDMAHNFTHFGPTPRPKPLILPTKLEKKFKENIFLNDKLILEKAVEDLGTQGDGNHFLFVGRSKQTGETMLVTHHGSRGIGALLYKKGMLIAEKFRKKIAPKVYEKNAWIPYHTIEGQAYWEALQITRAWTKLNHMTIHEGVSNLLGAKMLDNYWNEHNFVFKEGDLFYHAKGATPLTDEFAPDNPYGLRLIPLNMAAPILIVKGEKTNNNLGFAPHGAGRNMSRSIHQKLYAHQSKEERFAIETKGLDIRFYSKEIDISELPSAYKNAAAVKAQIKHFNLGEIVDEIMPYGCIMAGHFSFSRKKKNKK